MGPLWLPFPTCERRDSIWARIPESAVSPQLCERRHGEVCLQGAVHVTNGSELRHCQAHWKTKAVHLFKILSTVILFSELSKLSMCHDTHERSSQLDPEGPTC